MGTSMHRLQISLPEWQVRYLLERAQQEGSSMAEIIRQLIRRAAETHAPASDADSLWEIAGLAEDTQPLKEGLPVSERPDAYLADAILLSERDRGASSCAAS